MHARVGTVLLATSLGGCFGADLRKVHLPDLLVVDAKTAAAARPGSPLDSTKLPAPKPVRQLHASFVDPYAMVDGNASTVAVIADVGSRDQYVLVDLGCSVKIRQVEQIHGAADGFLARYRIDVAGEHNFPYDPAFIGCGSANASIATFRKARTCRFLRITQLEPGPGAWNVAELVIR